VRERHGVAENLFRVFCLSMLITREPTSGLGPLTCSLRVSCSRAEKATRAGSPCCWFQSILSAATCSKRTSCAPSISRARNLSSASFVLWDLHRRGCGGKDGGQPSALQRRSKSLTRGRSWKHETYSEHLRQQIVRATEPGFLGHLCVRYIGSTIMTDAVESAAMCPRPGCIL
jgi:hypothetical protein